MTNNDIVNYYQTIFVMKKHHSFLVTEIENMYPFERNVYYDMIRNEIEKSQQKQQQSNVYNG